MSTDRSAPFLDAYLRGDDMSNVLESMAQEIAHESIKTVGERYNVPNRCPTPDVAHSKFCKDTAAILIESIKTIPNLEAKFIISAARKRGVKLGNFSETVLIDLIGSVLKSANR